MQRGKDKNAGGRESPPALRKTDQKLNFAPICTMRGRFDWPFGNNRLDELALVVPKFPDVGLMFGPFGIQVLVKLNASNRNCAFIVSVILKRLLTERFPIGEFGLRM